MAAMFIWQTIDVYLSNFWDKQYKRDCPISITVHVPTDIAVLQRDDSSENTY